jgi:hypothetical protein
MEEKGNVWEFHPSSNAVAGDPVDVRSYLLQLTDTGKMVHHLSRHLNQRYRTLSFNVYIDNCFTIRPLLGKLHRVVIEACGTSGK